jgi:hypothetical protein
MSTTNILFGLATRNLHDDDLRGHYEPKMKGYIGYSGLKLGNSTRSVMLALNGPLYYNEIRAGDKSIRNNIDTFWPYTQVSYNGPGEVGKRFKNMSARYHNGTSIEGCIPRKLLTDVWVLGSKGEDRGYIVRGGQYYLVPVLRKRVVTLNVKNKK